MRKRDDLDGIVGAKSDPRIRQTKKIRFEKISVCDRMQLWSQKMF